MVSWADFLAAHGSDADIRKGWDPLEAPKHYIDIDAFPEFLSSGAINQNFDSLVAQHGLNFVMDQGILPWALLETFDSLKAAFQISDWDRAKLLASDLGHYVGDSHMPLHITLNYNGYATNQGGIHSRYETTMINTYSSLLQFDGDSLVYVENPEDYVFQSIYSNYIYVDSVLAADLAAKNLAGSYNNSYYQELWSRTKNFTIVLLKNASSKLANLIYTAWIDAGSPVLTNIQYSGENLYNFNLEQNYPNPFNPYTKIKFALGRLNNSAAINVTLKIYDVLGNEIKTVVDEQKSPGAYEVEFDGGGLQSGVYFYNLQAGQNSITKKLILLK
jgi:hypothetical protein